MSDLTPNSFFSYLPGSPAQRRRQGRRELVLTQRDTSRPQPSSQPRAPAAIAKHFNDQIATVEAAFCGYDPFDLALGLIALSIQHGDDSDATASLPAAELGWTLLAGERRHGPIRDPNPMRAVRSVYDRLRAAAFMSSPHGELGRSQPEWSLHGQFFRYTRTVRILRFDDQEQETLRATWGGPSAALCGGLIGASIDDCLAIVGTLSRLSRQHLMRLDRSVDAAVGEARRMATVSLAEVAAEAGIDDATCRAVLMNVTTEVGTQHIPDIHADSRAIRAAPVLRDGDELLCLAPQLLLRALGPKLEALLADAGDQPATEKWQRRRGAWLERESISTLERFLRPDLFQTNLSYDGGEIDGLLVLDDAVILLEAKAGAVRTLQALNDPGRFDADLDRLLHEPLDALRRARVALLEGKALRPKRGAPFTLPSGPRTRIYTVIVTLESLAPIASQLWQLKRSGQINAREPLPWMLSLAHLQTICELLEWPAQLVHFLRRRVDIDPRIDASDEQDFVFGYLRWGLEFSTVLDVNAEKLTLPNGNDELNPWMFYRRGWYDRPVPRPQIELAPDVKLEVRAGLHACDRERRPGWLGASFDLLDYGFRETPRTPSVNSRF